MVRRVMIKRIAISEVKVVMTIKMIPLLMTINDNRTWYDDKTLMNYNTDNNVLVYCNILQNELKLFYLLNLAEEKERR